MDALSEWMGELCNKAESTRERYQTYLQRFCEFLDTTPDGLVEQRKKDLQSKDPKTQMRMERSLKEFINHLREKGFKVATLQVAYAAINSFFEFHYMPLKMRRADYPYGESLGHRAATKEDIRRLLEKANRRQKAIILFLKDSGLRVSDLIRLRYGDVKGSLERGDQFIPIRIVTEKNNTVATTFIGPEAVSALKDYIKWRAKREELKDESPLFRVSGGRRDPMTRSGVSSSINHLIELAGLKGEISAHSLRKYFQTQLESAKMSFNWIKAMMGHKLSGVEAAYSKPTEETLKKAYIEAYDHLRIFEEDSIERVKLLEKYLEEERTRRLELERRLSPENIQNLVMEYLRSTIPPEIASLILSKTKYEYITIPGKEESEIINRLNSGWEIVREINNSIILKKPKF
jgi:integrase